MFTHGQYFGFEILTIEDFGDGRLALQFCLDQTTTTLFYNDNDELSMESAGSVVGTIESSSKFRLFEAVRGGIEYPDAINFAAGTVNKDVFTRMNSDLNSTIAQLTTTLPEGSSYSYPLTCVVYWEKAFNDQEGAKFDNFYMYNGEEAGTEQGVASEHHGSLYIQQSQRITIYSDDTDGDGTVVSGIELGEF